LPSIDPTAQALVIGVSRYQHLGKLLTTQDVPGVRDVLTSPELCGYPPERVVVLDEEHATRDHIIAALGATAARASATGSRTFVYFSGHGGTGKDGQSYLLPVDAQPGRYAATAIAARELSHQLAGCAGELTVVLDCCRAAGLAMPAPAAAPGPTGAPPTPAASAPGPELAPFTDSLRSELAARDLVVFAASPADGNSYASPTAPYGIFTGHLLDGLRGAASTSGGDVTVAQLFDYLQQRVVLSSSTAQRPVFIAHTEAFYPLTRYPRPIPPSPVFDKDVYISYDDRDPALRAWVTGSFEPQLAAAGCSIWHHDDLGALALDVEQAIVRSRYVIVLITAAYLRDRMNELISTMAVLQAIYTRTPRFLPVVRELCNLPLWIQAFCLLDLTPRTSMEHRDQLARLVKRLHKPPHER
jgi:hypothetical protein